jgi:D-glycerate 3-kinase
LTESLDLLDQIVSRWLVAPPHRPLIVGLCGAQGSGKSTLAGALLTRLRARGVRAASLSLDDLYLSRDERARLARDVHPLLRTRGVPLTHDVGLGLRILADLRVGRPVRLPRFDKATDEPLPDRLWEPVPSPLDLLIFEGWCVGARPQPDSALAAPVNALERERDPGGRWRRAVNAALAGPYAQLFAALDRLVLLAAPNFDVVRTWRLEQEDALRASLPPAHAAGLMDEAGVNLFVQHYERITRAILSEMPGRADLVINLDAARRVREAP